MCRSKGAESLSRCRKIRFMGPSEGSSDREYTLTERESTDFCKAFRNYTVAPTTSCVAEKIELIRQMEGLYEAYDRLERSTSERNYRKILSLYQPRYKK